MPSTQPYALASRWGAHPPISLPDDGLHMDKATPRCGQLVKRRGQHHLPSRAKVNRTEQSLQQNPAFSWAVTPCFWLSEDPLPHAAFEPQASSDTLAQRGKGEQPGQGSGDLPGRVEEGGEMSRRESSYSSSDSEGLAGRESLATTRVRALFSASSCSFICLRV